MGVPAFYRWLSEKYPKIIQDVLEERVKVVGDSASARVPFDNTKPNPTGLECDNLYIDMNGIIHPCSHPEQGPQPTTEEEMYENVCQYVDRLFRIMRPRKLLYLAIDGVAPRAKMNQQRSRRFRSAQEARENHEVEQSVRDELLKMGQNVPPAKKAWDSNVITPGTPFMLRLSEFLRFYIRKRISTDKAWQQIRVIFSDASIPGEGEHKIMAHVRLQRSQPGYSPNLVHILHGLDADLIMLALATHEAHFYISREEVLFGRKSAELNERRQLENGFREKQRQLDEAAGDVAMQLLENRQKPLCRVSIPILREYLAFDFASCIDPRRLPFTPSLERLIDDFVFLCFFVGNDFLPHLPSLDIRDGALDYLYNVYKRILPTLGGYITNHGGKVNLSHVDVILAEVGAIEDYVFQMKHDNSKKNEERQAQFKARKKNANGRSLDNPMTAIAEAPKKVKGKAARILEKQEARELKKPNSKKIKVSHVKKEEKVEKATPNNDSKPPIKIEQEETMEMESDKGPAAALKLEETDASSDSRGEKRKLPAEIKKEDDDAASTGVGVVGDIKDEFEADADDDGDDDDDDDDKPPSPVIPPMDDEEVAAAFKEKVKARQQKQLDEYSKTVEDKVRLHEEGWKDRYYSDKCKADDVAAHGGREHLFRSYVMGLCWVMKYYYEGCPSWKWFYPFHYGPFASDLKNIERFAKDCDSFEQSTPFNPVEQLMAVLPSDSKAAVPKAARWLMDDPESPIIDFYPKDVPVDPNGKAMPWLWVVLLPFIEEDRLLDALTPTTKDWTAQELLGNARGLDDGYLYISSSHPLATKLAPIVQAGKSAKSPKVRLTDTVSYGCPGFTGSVRPPLSNELVPFGEEETLQPPPAPVTVAFSSHDNIFVEKIEGHTAICVAFSEPARLSHKSILVAGARPPKAALTEADRRIQRPRLNRGGGTIANMGTSNGQSFKGGYGSMNMGNYERNLAEQTGRGKQMYQPGNRAWGAMAPTPKQVFQPSNPFAQGHPGQQQGHHQQQYNNARGPVPGRGPPQNRQHFQGRGQPQQWQHQQPLQQFHQHQQRPNQPPYGQPPNQFNPRQGYNQRGNQPQPPQHMQPQPQQGFNFRAMNRQPAPGRIPPPPRPSAQANASVMKSLKAQLASTLQQNKQSKK